MKHNPRKIISIVLLLFFAPFAIWSIATKRLALFFIVALIIYFGQMIMNKYWPIQFDKKKKKISTDRNDNRRKNRNTRKFILQECRKK